MMHVVLAPVLGPGACAANSGGAVEPSGGDGGRKQADWQVAACELHVIMQFVVVEVCADAAPTSPAIAETATAKANHRMTAGLQSRPRL
jgi:hypothetical protein